MELLRKNGKLEKTSVHTMKGPSLQAGINCSKADRCKQNGRCYAMNAFYLMPNVREAHKKNKDITLSESFTDMITAEVKYKNLPAVRIHDSGDFYAVDYAVKWCTIAARCPQTQFYAYTKEVSMMKNLQTLGFIPRNMTIIYSYGGKEDHLIYPEFDRHCHVFKYEEDIEKHGYVNAHADDTQSWKNPSKKIGVAYHGPKSKMWWTYDYEVTHG